MTHRGKRITGSICLSLALMQQKLVSSESGTVCICTSGKKISYTTKI